MSTELTIAVILAACGAVGVVSHDRGRNPLAWFFIALVVTPVLAAILLFVLPPNQEAIEEESLARGDTRRCSKCDEVIRRDADRCRHCGYDRAEAKKVAAGPQALPGPVDCKKCGQTVEARPDHEGKFIKCSKCQAAVYVPYGPTP
ncbi:MAG TPA: hypothetical protein VJU16_03555 [Planctomycetota bacterium]|nr:hypothetical protein [Planctomycetota bacterium]